MENEYNLINYENLPSVFCVIISNKMSNLKELKYDLTHEDVLNLYDIICIDNYNKYVIQKTNQKKE